VQRAWDRRRGERQHVHRELQRFQPLLVPDPESVLLVHDQQPQVVKPDVAGEQPVGADHQVHAALLQALDDSLRVPGIAEPREHFDPDRVIGEPLSEGAPVLLGEDRGGGEHRDLFARLHRLERGPQRDFRLAVADVADQQPVHRPGALHVALHLLSGATLVGRVFVQEGRFQLALPRGVGRECEPGRELAAPVQIEELGRHLPDGGPGLISLALPRGRPETVQLGRRGVAVPGGAVGLELIQPVERDVEPVAAFVFDDRHLERPALRADRDRLDPAIQPDPVFEVHHVVSRLQRTGRRRRGRLTVTPRPPQAACAPKDLVVGQHAERRQDEPAVERADRQRRGLRAEQLLQPLELALVVAQDHRRRAGRHQPA